MTDMMELILIGAGGHARVIYHILKKLNYTILGFIDKNVEHFSDLKKLPEEILLKQNNAVLAFGGINPEQLTKRYESFQNFKKQNIHFPPIIDSSALLFSDLEIGEGTTIHPGVKINANVKIGEAVIINTGAIIEHDVIIGNGTHIAPGAIVLAGTSIGKNCMVGAGALVLPSSVVPDGTFIPALSKFLDNTIQA